MRRHIDVDAWVDSAAADLMRSSAVPEVGDVLARVLDLVRQRRQMHDIAFANTLAAVEEPAELCVERCSPTMSRRLLPSRPVLLS
jgi:hypothetical protein